MHILYISNLLPRPDEPGAARPWVEATYLKRQGHRITVITNQRHYLTDQIPQEMQGKLISASHEAGLNILSVASPAGRRTSKARRILNYFCFMVMAFYAGLKTRDVDLIYVRTPPILIPVTGLMLARLKRARFVIFIGDLHPEEAVALGLVKSPPVITLWDLLENFLRRRADLLVTPIPGIKRLLTKKGFPADFIVVNTNAYDSAKDRQEPLPAAIESRLARLNGRFPVIYAGTIGLGHPLEVVIEAAGHLQPSHPEIHFIIVGQGDKLSFLKEMADRQCLKNVTFLGTIPRLGMAALLARAKALVHLTYSGEFHGYNLPNKIFEYMGAGKPIVFSGTGDIAEIIQCARNGMVVSPEDPRALAGALVHLWKNQTEAAEMGQRGREYVRENFNREKILGSLNRELISLVLQGADYSEDL
jgi:colanic acid biosynthesis glycosyl transferase WcaI